MGDGDSSMADRRYFFIGLVSYRLNEDDSDYSDDKRQKRHPSADWLKTNTGNRGLSGGAWVHPSVSYITMIIRPIC